MDDAIRRLSGNGNPVGAVKMDADSRFNFSCHSGLECFTECCGKIEIILSPYDVLRIKQVLGVTSEEFLLTYTRLVNLKGVKLPFFMLRMTGGGRCPFVTPGGCSIYADRPLACRYYPIGLGLFRERGAGGGDFYFPIKEPYCRGYGEEKEWTIREWRRSQGIDDYDRVNKDWFDIILMKNLLAPDLDPDERSQRLYILCSFNPDGFGRFVFESRFLDLHRVDDRTVERIREDEVELLRFGLRWLKGVLFGPQR